MRQTQLFIPIWVAILFLTSCIQEDFKKIKKLDWNPELAIPLASANYTLGDLLAQVPDQGLVTTDSENIYTITYAGELYEIVGSDLVDLIDIPYAFPDTAIQIPFPSINGNIIQKLVFKSGQLDYDISLVSQEDVTVVLTIPDATDPDGNVFEKTIEITYSGDSMLQRSGSFDLTDHTFNFPLDSLNNGLFRMNYQAFTTATSQIVEPVIFTGKFKNLAFKYLEGYFGYQQIGFQIDTIFPTIFDPWKSGTLYIDDPRISVFFLNSIGLPIQGSLSNVSFSQGQQVFQLTGSVFQDSILIGFPGIDSAGWVESTELVIDRTNSNIRNGVAISPKAMTFAMDLFASADPDLTELNFAYDTSRLKVNYELELPLAFRLDQVRVRDTFGLEGQQFENIDYVDFLIISENGLPFTIDLQGYFLDQNGTVLDSILEDEAEILISAVTNDRGLLSQPVSHTVEIRIDGDKLDAISQTKYLALVAEVSTPENAQKTIRLTPQNFISLKVSAKTGINP